MQSYPNSLVYCISAAERLSRIHFDPAAVPPLWPMVLHAANLDAVPTEEKACQVLQRFPGVEVISIAGCIITKHSELIQLLAKRSVKSLNVDACRGQGVLPALLAAAPTLTELDIRRPDGAVMKQLNDVIDAAPHLVKVHGAITREGALASLSRSRCVESFKLDGVNIVDLATCVGSLKHLELSGDGLSEKGAESVSRCTKLLTLRLENVNRGDAPGLLKILRNCSALVRFSLRASVWGAAIETVDDAVLRHLPSRLVQLELAALDGVRDATLEHIAQQCTALRSLALFDLVGVTEAGVRSLERMACSPNLTTLRLQLLGRGTCNAPSLEGFPALTCLALHSVPFVNHQLHPQATLRCLFLGGSGPTSLEGALAVSGPSLRYLSLDPPFPSPNAVTALLQILQKCPWLRSLTTTVAVREFETYRAIVDLCPLLAYLSIEHAAAEAWFAAASLASEGPTVVLCDEKSCRGSEEDINRLRNEMIPREFRWL